MTFNKIKILPDFISNKIAAGEVVQRPESVVKELIENSIDANANTIEVIVKRAGKVLIQVIDDGEGMSEEDVVASLHRHATSKISTFEDLDSIKTLGFRGEALSSIAAVSNVEIKTETKEDEIGTLVRVEDESNIIKEKGSYAKGTSIAVKNLFYNTPARRNFLKSNATELKHILDTFKRTALSHPALSFKFWNDDDLIFDFPEGSIGDRMKSIFADNILDAVVEVKEITDYISLTGFVGKPKFLSKSRTEQYLFINKRYVSNKTVSHAVFSSYENILEKGSYPFFVLFLDLDPAKVNVNVHPSKLEIKFDDEKNIYSYVQAVVKKSLGSFDLVPAMSFDPSVEDRERLKYDNLRKIDKNDFSDRPDFNSRTASGQRRENIFSEEEIDVLFSSINPEIKRDSSGGETSHPFEDQGDREIYHSKDKDSNDSSKKSDSGLTFIVSLQNKYILSPIKSGLMIIDQHVAHERILYEKVLKLFRS